MGCIKLNKLLGFGDGGLRFPGDCRDGQDVYYGEWKSEYG
jgi:hypothetical protein